MLSTKEISELWGISERMVRRFCVDGRIPEAKLENTNWFIPEGTPKPKRKPKTPIDESRKILTAFAKKVVYQRAKNNHYGIYEYIEDAPKCSVSAFEIIGGVVADGICLMAIKIPHDGSPAYWTVR